MDVFRHGVLIDRVDEENLIVTNARLITAHAVAGDVNYAVTQIGFGSGSAAPSLSDTGLTGAYLKAIASVTYPAAGQVAFGWSLANNQGNGIAIIEFGLFSANATLFSRRTRTTVINKDSSLSLTGTWTISF